MGLHDQPPSGLETIDVDAGQRFLAALQRLQRAHELRRHEPARHARHLAALWEVPLHEVGRATLFESDGEAVLAVVPADRKVSAPRFRALLGASGLHVLRGDRGVGRLGWARLPGERGALPAVPRMFGARCFVDARVMESSRLVLSLVLPTSMMLPIEGLSIGRRAGGHSLMVRPQDYVDATGAVVAGISGTTRLLPQGGMIDEQYQRAP